MTHTLRAATQQKNICKCGCGQPTELYRGKYNKFIHGHNRQGVKYESKLKGRVKPRPNWAGYLTIKKHDYHTKTSSKYIRLHRLVYEEYYKCCLLSWTVVHHIDGNRKNNEISNLEPMYKNKHDKLTAQNRYNKT